MSEPRQRLRSVGITIAALLILFVALSPTLLFGEPLSAFGLILMGGSLLLLGVLLRWRGGSNARTLGTILAVIGAVVLTSGLGLMALLLAGYGVGP